MSHAALMRLRQIPTAALTQPDPLDDALGMRLLRHHTKNALQRLIAQIANSDLRAMPGGEALAEDLERRIRLSARVSDALFGLTEAPGPLQARLTLLSRSVVELMADEVQTINTTVHVIGDCPGRFEATVLQVAHEMVTNAVKHGLHMRLAGEIELVLHGKRPGAPYTGVALVVRDNGWGPERRGFGEGLSTLELIAQRHGGRVDLVRQAGWTEARLQIPARG